MFQTAGTKKGANPAIIKRVQSPFSQKHSKQAVNRRSILQKTGEKLPTGYNGYTGTTSFVVL